MYKLLCDKCGREIKQGIRPIGEKIHPDFYNVEVLTYTGEGIRRDCKSYILCESCYSKIGEFLEVSE